MAHNKYAFQGFNKELMARAVGRDLTVSTKQAIEICNYLRKRKLAQAKMLLEKVIEKKQAVPFKRFVNGLGHKAGKMAEIAVKGEMWGVTDLDGETLKKAFIKPYKNLQQALDDALAAKGEDARVLIMMNGSMSIPMIKS